MKIKKVGHCSNLSFRRLCINFPLQHGALWWHSIFEPYRLINLILSSNPWYHYEPRTRQAWAYPRPERTVWFNQFSWGGTLGTARVLCKLWLYENKVGLIRCENPISKDIKSKSVLILILSLHYDNISEAFFHGTSKGNKLPQNEENLYTKLKKTALTNHIMHSNVLEGPQFSKTMARFWEGI